jgi:hypothetical protein
VIAAHSTACSSWSSNTILPAHAPSSWGYLPGPVMAPTAHQSQPPRIPGRFTRCVPPLPGGETMTNDAQTGAAT